MQEQEHNLPYQLVQLSLPVIRTRLRAGQMTTTFMTRRQITTILIVPPHIIRIGATTLIRPTQQTTWTSRRQSWGLVPNTDTLRPTMGRITHTGAVAMLMRQSPQRPC